MPDNSSTEGIAKDRFIQREEHTKFFSKKRIKFAVQVLLIGLICFYFGKNIVENWTVIKNFSWDIHISFLVVAIIFALMGFAIFPIGVKGSLALLSKDISYRTSFKLYFYSQMAKYLPGRFWILLGRIYLYEKQGIDKTNGSISLLFELLLQINGSLIVFFTSYLLFNVSQVSFKSAFLIGYLILSFAFLHPRIFGFLNNKLLKRFSNKVVTEYSFGKIISLQFLFIFYWILIGFSFFMLVCGIVSGKNLNPGYFVGILPGSWAIGFLSFLTPAGVGVREGFMTLLLKPYFPLSLAMTLAIIGRLWWTLFDLLFLGMAVRLKIVSE